MKKALVAPILFVTLGFTNLTFALSGRGKLYYLVAGLFMMAGILGFIGNRKKKE